jgi:hypothetical protein
MRTYVAGMEGRKLYAKRAGIEGTISHKVTIFGLYHSRYICLAKTHLQTRVAFCHERHEVSLDQFIGDGPSDA